MNIKQILQRSQIALAKVKTGTLPGLIVGVGKTSVKVGPNKVNWLVKFIQNEIHQIEFSLSGENGITRKVYNNIVNSIQL